MSNYPAPIGEPIGSPYSLSPVELCTWIIQDKQVFEDMLSPYIAFQGWKVLKLS